MSQSLASHIEMGQPQIEMGLGLDLNMEPSANTFVSRLRKPYEPGFPTHMKSRLPNEVSRKLLFTNICQYNNSISGGNVDTELRIQRLMMSLLPEISREYSKLNNLSPVQLTDWINTARQYVSSLYADFNQSCNHLLYEASLFQTMHNRSSIFEIDNIYRLPTEIVNLIKSYLPPESHISIYQDTIDNLSIILNKMTISWLQKILRCVVRPLYYKIGFTINRISPEIYSKSQLIEMRTCLGEDGKYFTKSLGGKKSILISRITIALRVYRTASRCPNQYIKYLYQSAGLKLIQSIIYASRQFQSKKNVRRSTNA